MENLMIEIFCKWFLFFICFGRNIIVLIFKKEIEMVVKVVRSGLNLLVNMGCKFFKLIILILRRYKIRRMMIVIGKYRVIIFLIELILLVIK